VSISIALTTFNGARYLPAQLASFAAQTRLPDELVVCDDESTDETLEVLERFQRTAAFPVRIFKNPNNLGFVRNFEQAISKCTGDLVFLSDQDDVWHASKIATIERIFEVRPDVSLVVHDGDLADQDLVTRGATKLSQVVRGFGSSDSLVMGALTAIRKNLLEYALPFPASVLGHDIWLHRLAGLLGARLVHPESLQLIRRHGANTSNWVASSVERIGRLDVWRSQYDSPRATSYQDRLSINDCCQAALARVAEGGNTFSKVAIAEAGRYLVTERRALLAREQLARSSGLRQKTLSFQLLWRGDYRFFNGYMSFLRDVTR
jgi:glycosyltransferase involved in cell wall biosynthesis